MARKKNSEVEKWAGWLDLASPERREATAELLCKHEVDSYKGLIKFSQSIMVELIRGTVPIDVAREVRAWAELVMTTIAADTTGVGTPEAAHEHILIALQTVARQARIRPTYISHNPLDQDLIDAEPEDLPALVAAHKR